MNTMLTWQSEEMLPPRVTMSASLNRRKQPVEVYNYTVIFEPEPEGGYHAFCPTLKGCHSQGETFAEAVENMSEAVQLYIDSLLADQQPLPEEGLVIKRVNIVI